MYSNLNFNKISIDYLINANEDNLLLNSGVYPPDEIKSLLSMRQQLYVKIQQKDKPSLLKFIKCERKIFQKLLTLHRKDKNLCKQCILRIMKAYDIGLIWFKDDLEIWLSYIQFCTQIGDVNKVTETLPLILQIHTNSNLWLIAANWEIIQFNNTDKALSYLYSGIDYNPTAKDLYTEIMKLELSMADNYNELRALHFFEIMKKNFKDPELYITFLEICGKYDYTHKLQVQLCLYIIRSFYKNEDIWSFLADRELSGHHITNITHNLLNDDHVANHTYELVKDRRKQINNCLKIYNVGIALNETEKLWEKYLNTLVDLYEKPDDKIIIQETFKSICKTAHEKGYMTENHYMKWLDAIKGSPGLPIMLAEATARKPHYIKLWAKRILCQSETLDDDIIDNIFDEAVKSLGDDSIPIWRLKIQYYQLRSNSIDKIESVYTSALNFSPKISMLIQPQYLHWLSLFHNTDVVHKAYKELSEKKPFCIDLHKKMLELEAMSIEPSDEIFQSIKNTISNNPECYNEWKKFFIEANFCEKGLRPICEKYFPELSYQY